MVSVRWNKASVPDGLGGPIGVSNAGPNEIVGTVDLGIGLHSREDLTEFIEVALLVVTIWTVQMAEVPGEDPGLFRMSNGRTAGKDRVRCRLVSRSSYHQGELARILQFPSAALTCR